MVRSPALMRELWLEMWHDMHPAAESKFVTKGGAFSLFVGLLSYLLHFLKSLYHWKQKRGDL